MVADLQESCTTDVKEAAADQQAAIDALEEVTAKEPFIKAQVCAKLREGVDAATADLQGQT